jgi:general secretion pathway protein D
MIRTTGKRSLTVTALFVSAALAIAQTPAPPPPPAATAPGYNLKNASLLDVIDIMARDLHLNYILDSRVKSGSVTISTYGEVKVTDLRPIFETILRMNGLAMVQVGNIFRIVQSGDVSHLPISPQTNLKDFPENEQMILNLIFLKYMTAAEMEGILKPFLGESATMVTYTPANLLMIEDNARNMRRTTELINLFDSDQFAGQRVQLFTTQNSRPTDLVKELDTVFKAYALNEKTSAVRFLPIDRINTVLAVAANAGVFVTVADWIKKLDVPVRIPAGAVDNYFYKLKYGRAEVIGGVISQLYGQGGGLGALGSGYQNAGQRFNGGGFPGSSNGLGGAASISGSNYPGGNFGGTFGSNGTSGYPSATGTATTPGTTQPPSALAGAFAAPATAGAAGTPGGAPGTFGTAPGTTPDQTGSYLGSGVTSSGGLPRIVPNPFDNSILVQGTPQQWQQILRLLEQLDVSPRQVLIDARIYEVDLNDSLAYGVTDYLTQKGAFNSNVPGLQLLGAASSAGVVLSAGTLVGQSRQLLGYLTASDLRQRTKVLSAPSVIATDSIPASINVGSSVPTLSAVAPGISVAGSTQFTQSIQNQSTGVALNILARVNASGVVTMVIDQSVTSPQATTPGGSGSTIDSPSFSQRQVSTQVTVQDGDTIAIGGIIQESNIEASSGIPGLHRIPYIGGIFGTKSFTKQRTELIVFLTPRVIYDTNQVADATQELREKVKGLLKNAQ